MSVEEVSLIDYQSLDDLGYQVVFIFFVLVGGCFHLSFLSIFKITRELAITRCVRGDLLLNFFYYFFHFEVLGVPQYCFLQTLKPIYQIYWDINIYVQTIKTIKSKRKLCYKHMLLYVKLDVGKNLEENAVRKYFLSVRKYFLSSSCILHHRHPTSCFPVWREISSGTIFIPSFR